MKKSIGYSLLFVCLFWMIGNPMTINAMSQEEIATTIDEAIEEKVSEENIPNAAVSVVHDGEIIFEKGYGYADIELEIPVYPETSLFRVGSIAKLMTWTAVMQLVEQGKLDLDTDINEDLDFEIPAYSGSTPITLRHLFTHTPGFEDYANEVFTLEEEKLLSLQDYVRQLLPERIFPAGEVLAYSNYGAALAGYIVERTSGMSYSSYIEENIFSKLDMNVSTFDQPVPTELSDYSITPYRYVDGDFREAAFEYMPEPAGAMSTSASDIAKFMIAYLQNGRFGDETILQEETVDEMFQQQFTQHPAINGMTLGFFEGNVNGKRVLFHGGSTMLFNSILYLLPDEDIGIFISFSGGSHLVHNEVLQQFMDVHFPMEETAFALETTETDNINQYAGEYQQNRRSLTTEDKLTSLMMGIIRVEADKNGHLNVTHVGETHPFYETDPGVFKSTRTERSPDAYGNFTTIVFEEDANGNMMLMADGPMTYTKAPWYESSAFTFVTLASSIILIIGTLFSWMFIGIVRILRKKSKEKDKVTNFAKIVAVLYGLSIVSLLVSVLLNGGVDPVYQLPKDAYGMAQEPHFIVEMIPYVIILSSIALVVFSVVLWKRKSWRIFGRIHYTLYTSTAIFFIWVFSYWNL